MTRPERQRRLVCSLLVVAAIIAGCAGGDAGPEAAPALTEGPWRAWLDSPGGELPFGLELATVNGELGAWIVNGPEREAVERVRFEDGRLGLHIDHYDAVIEASLSGDGDRLDGAWRRRSAGDDAWAGLDFHAVPGPAPRFPSGTSGEAGEVAGRWSVSFESDEIPAVGVFEDRGEGSVTGTFLTATGDYRFLGGVLDGDRLRLSVFDGAHAFLFEARLQEDGTLAGDFWSRDTWHETWTARREPDAGLPDPFQMTAWSPEADLASIVYPDLDGRPRSLADEAFAGKARILVVFGSWCPNCHDASDYLVELHDRYRDRGLSILGLAFEHTGDLARDTEQVRRYAAYHGIEYPVLVAGLSDKAKASESFTAIDRVRAYPTFIFMDADDTVRAVYTGFNGPATGPAHTHLRDRFESLIEDLLG